MAEEEFVGIVPTGDQTAEDIAAVVAQAAAEEGLDQEVVIGHRGDEDVVLVPRSLAMSLDSFPPKNAGYATPGLVELVDTDNPAGSPLVVIEGWQPTVDHRK